MKKVLQISISQTLFTIEEDAYATLAEYLASIRTHFADASGSGDIIADIESRIAEQLVDTKEKIISLEGVSRVINIMGHVEDFGDAEDEQETVKDTGRKIYRNPDNVVLGGVSSGLAAYWKVDPLWVRLGFIALTFFNGIGIILYLVLWLILPVAKTNSQKLEMSGTPVTLETLSETARERIEEVKKRNGGRLERIITFPFIVLGRTIRFLGRIISPLVRISVGILLTIVSIGVLAFITLACGFLISDTVWITEGVSVTTLFPGGIFPWVIIIAAGLTILIPAFFVLLGGVGLLLKRSVIPGSVMLSILGVWFVALLLTGFGVAKVVANYHESLSTTPTYTINERNIMLPQNFNKFEVSSDIDVHIIKSASTTLSARGRQIDLDTLDVRVENGTLYVERNKVTHERVCLFCNNETIEMTLEVPELTEVTARRGSFIDSDDFPAQESVDIQLINGSRADFRLSANNVRAVISAGAELSLVGRATNMDATLDIGSTLSARTFTVEHATTSAIHGSFAEFEVTKSLNATAEFGSEIIYTGSASVTEAEEYNGNVRKRDSRAIQSPEPVEIP